jgi:PAS domain S-box-containing protein
MLVDQAIIAIANAQLYEQTDQALAQRVDDLSKLYQASLKLAFSTETYDVLKYIGKMAHELTRSDSVSIFIYNHQTDSFEPAAALGAGLPEDQGTCMRPAGMTRRAVTERRSFIIADTELETNLVNPAVRQAGIRSVICMPLISKGQVLGVMYVNSTQPNKYSDNDTQLISALANQAAVAIENGQLFKRMAQDHDRLQAVLDTTREGFMMLDTSGRIIFTNAMFGELFEMPSASLTGHRLADVIAAHAAELDDARSAMMDVIYDTLTELAEKTEAPHKSTVAMTYPPRFIERISLPVFDASGTVIGRLLTLRDITEEKKAEAMREDLMRMLVHDLRSPLTSILGGLQVLELELTDERHLRAIRVALQGSNRLLDLINALLDVNRMEAGQMPLKRQAVEWPALVSEATERVKSLAVNSKVTLQSEWATDLPAVYADQAVIIRVLINLLDNAIKYSPANAVIKVAVTHSNKETVCRVTDAGPGIPAEYQNRIFEKFFQVPNEAEKRRGTGLGLAFCRLAVEAHGGRIWIESAPGRGSTFAFTLPVEN